jgi:hypothetical protein
MEFSLQCPRSGTHGLGHGRADPTLVAVDNLATAEFCLFHQNAHKGKLQPDEPAYPLQIQDASRIGSMLSAGCLSFRDFQSPEDCEGLEDHSNPDIVGSGVRLSISTEPY